VSGRSVVPVFEEKIGNYVFTILNVGLNKSCYKAESKVLKTKICESDETSGLFSLSRIVSSVTQAIYCMHVLFQEWSGNA
jgi:hypothetical protein